MRCGFQSNDFSDSNVLGYITKSMVLVSPSIKICNLFFFSLLACRTCRSRIGTVLEKRKKKETLLGHRSLATRTGSGVRHIAKNAVLVQPSLNQASNSQAFNKVTFFSIDKK